MDITFGIVHFADGIKRAELHAETNERIYSYRLTSYGDIQHLVNFHPVDVLPVTTSTRRLSVALDKVYQKLIRMLSVDDTSAEYKSLYWEVKEILESV